MTRFRSQRDNTGSLPPKTFASQEEGSVLLLVALAIFSLITVAGAAIDVGNQQLVKNRLQQATDIAALAAAGLPATSTVAERQQVAQRYFNLNYPNNFMGTERPTVTVDVLAESLDVRTTNVKVPVYFIALNGTEGNFASSSSTVAIATNEGGTLYDMILVFDNSHSMAAVDGGTETRMDSVKSAALTLINDLLSVEMGNRMAAITWDTAVLRVEPFTESQAIMTNFVNSMAPSIETGTNSNTGLTRALGMDNDTRTKEGDNAVVKVAILLTDGANTDTVNNNATSLATADNLKRAGFLVYTIAFGKTVTGSRCTYYTRGQGAQTGTPSQETDPHYCPKPFLANVASGGHSLLPNGSYENQSVFFYIAPTEEELAETFTSILANIRKLRVTE